MHITGRFIADDTVQVIKVNGKQLFGPFEHLGVDNPMHYQTYRPFELDQHFKPGRNVIEFVVQNAGDGVNPLALLVEFNPYELKQVEERGTQP